MENRLEHWIVGGQAGDVPANAKMMVFYRGEESANWQPNSHILSRYGIPVVFGTTSMDMAKRYAAHKKGYVYKINLCIDPDRINYAGMTSVNRRWGEMVFQYYLQGTRALWIENVVDYPHDDYATDKATDVVMVFDFECIDSAERVSEQIKVL